MSVEEGIVEHLVIPGSLDELPTVHEWTRQLLDRAGVPEDLKHNVLLALSESVTNAIRHGCKSDKTQKVKLECRCEKDEETSGHCSILFRVRDRGEGFTPDGLPNPTDGPHLFRSGGRGVFLVRALSHEADFDTSPDGTTVTFRFEWE